MTGPRCPLCDGQSLSRADLSAALGDIRAEVFEEAARLCDIQAIGSEAAAVCAKMMRERADMERKTR